MGINVRRKYNNNYYIVYLLDIWKVEEREEEYK